MEKRSSDTRVDLFVAKYIKALNLRFSQIYVVSSLLFFRILLCDKMNFE